MDKPMIRTHNTETDQVIDRQMTAEEFKIYEADQKAQLLAKNEEESKAAQRQAILDRLGLSSEEAALLLS